MQVRDVNQSNKSFLSRLPRKIKAKYLVFLTISVAVIAGLYILSRYNYPLFHSATDMVTVFIAASVFMVVWNSRRSLDNHYYLFIGIAFLSFALLNFLHLVGNKDMGVFPQYGNLGPTLYIASRYILGLSFLLAPLFIKRKLNAPLSFALFLSVTLLVILSIFHWRIFPATYIEGVGLTSFKINSDYLICLLLLGAAGLLYINRRAFDAKILGLLIGSIALSIATGLAFTLYTDPFGITNAVGHFFQIASFSLVYLALIETVLTRPQNILFRSLAQREEAFKRSSERLSVLSQATSQLLSSEDPEKMVQSISGKVMDHLGCDCFFNFIVDESAGRLRLNAFAGIPEDTAQGIKWLNYGEAICGCAARDGCRIVSEDIQNNQDARAALVRSFGIQAYAAHPLIVGLKTVGTLSFGTRSRTRFTESELEFMKDIANQVSIAMERKINHEYLKHYASELEAANQELESFSYSVSHDLRAPLRSLDGFSEAVLTDYSEKLDATGKEYLGRIRKASQTMAQLIDGVLKLSRISRAEMHEEEVNLSNLVQSITDELKAVQPERRMDVSITPGIIVRGDSQLLNIALRNLMENAWKYTGKCTAPVVEFGWTFEKGDKTFFIRDNGVGFDMRYRDKLFHPFQRLHTEQEYPGTGIGLATVQRVIHRHRGKIWAESEPGKRTTFYFTIGE